LQIDYILTRDESLKKINAGQYLDLEKVSDRP
jgi:hypothetical protein